MKFILSLLRTVGNTLYLFFLYFKRGFWKTLFYFFTLLLISVIVGMLLESNAKMSLLVEKITSLLPTNRIKVTIPQTVKREQTNPAILSFFGNNKQEENKVIRTKNYITPQKIEELKKIKGINQIVPIHNVDFPLGVEFAFPGSGMTFRMEIIGIGLPSVNASKYVKLKENKKFKIKGKEVPVLVASYIVQIFNVILENNDIDFKLSEKNILGLRFNAVLGDSLLGASGGKKEVYQCKVVGFIDVDYTYGLVFPEEFTEKYKKIYWKNFKKGYYDSLMLELSLENFEELQDTLKKKGFQIKEDTSLFKRISDFIQKNQEAVAIFLKLISAVILFLGMIIAFYTIFWMLKDRALEFSLYRFFGSSNLRIWLLYSLYLSLINLLSILACFQILKKIFSILGQSLSQFQEWIPAGFESILTEDFLYQNIVLSNFSFTTLGFLEISGFSIVFLYLLGLNKKL